MSQRHGLEMYRSFGISTSPVLFGLRIDGDVDPDALQTALTLVGRKHESLRQYFPAEEAARQSSACLVADEYELPLMIIDSPPDRLAAEHTMAGYLMEPFDVARPPLARASLIRLPSQSLLALAIDHAIFDGGSIAPYLHDLEEIYERLLHGEAAADGGDDDDDDEDDDDGSPGFGEVESRWLDGNEAEEALRYWEPRWRAAVPALSNPLVTVADTRPPAQIYTRHERIVPAADVAATLRRYRSAAPTLFCLAAAAVVHALHTVTGVQHPSLFFHTSRREDPWAIGSFVNSLLLSVDLRGSEDFATTAHRTADEVLSSMMHSMMPYQVLRARFAPDQPSDLASMPAIVVNFMTESEPGQFAGLPAGVFLPSSAWKPQVRAYHHPQFFVLNVIETVDGGVQLISSFREPPGDSAVVHRFTAVVAEVLAGG